MRFKMLTFDSCPNSFLAEELATKSWSKKLGNPKDRHFSTNSSTFRNRLSMYQSNITECIYASCKTEGSTLF